MPSPRLLHLVHRLPYPPDKGDRIRSFHTLKYLSQRARISLACLADEPLAGEEQNLRELCERVAIVPLSRWGSRLRGGLSLLRGLSATAGVFQVPALRNTLQQWVHDTTFDAVLVSSSSMVPYLREKALRDIPAIVDLVDVDSQKWLDYAAASRGCRSWLYRTEGNQLRRLEKDVPSWARGVVLTTPAEVALYESFAGVGTAQVVANGVDLEYFRPAPPSDSASFVFVGALDYRPNVDGICWFCEEVWPGLRERRPDAILSVVGRRPTEAVQRLRAVPGVEVVGTVPDVRPYLTRAAVAIVPLRIARGVQNKILEALAMARPVVASPLCLAGLGTEIGHDLLSASTPTEWVEHLCLLEDVDERRRLGENGRTFVERHHCWETCLEPLAKLLFS